jgi:7-cyano-7-deazaguanine tRNA-ribosyltransferase
MSFEIKDIDAGGRIGLFTINSKQMITPNLFPVVSPFDNLIKPRDMYEHFKVQAIFTNAYIIYNNIGKKDEIVKKGLHKHLDFPGIIATDSGGFQDYMYGGDIKITPEEIEPFQETLGSDCPVILDIPVQTTDTHEEARKKVDITIERAKENIKRRKKDNLAWFGPIHGSIYSDILKDSAIEMSKLDFGVYAIGGVVKTFIDYRFDLDVSILLQVRKNIRPDKPLHMFGLGLPSFFALAVACGADTFDSAAYYLYAKEGRYFTLQGTKHIKDLKELPCHCPVCTTYTSDELRKLNKQEQLKQLASHNLYLSFSELRTIRESIRDGTLWNLVQQRVQAHPKLIKAFNLVKNHHQYFEELINLNKTKGFKFFGDRTMDHPEVYRFQQKMRKFKLNPLKSKLVFLPELDLPTLSGKNFSDWVKTLKSRPNSEEIQIFIISNLFGIIPLELASMHPVGQHEGNFSIQKNSCEFQVLERIILDYIKLNQSAIKSIEIFLPLEYKSEYNEILPFKRENHLINFINEILENNFKISTTIIEDLE